MDHSVLYRENYSFAKEEHKKKRKRLIFISAGFIFLILISLLYSAIASWNPFAGKRERVSRVFSSEEKAEIVNEEYKELEDLYIRARVPYEDPEGRFSIIFMTPYVSDEVGVVIKTEKDYDKVKAEADRIISDAKKKVRINSVTYLNDIRK